MALLMRSWSISRNESFIDPGFNIYRRFINEIEWQGVAILPAY
nr:MAG TPA: hypothetical protein [Caudoviricetes sp.]